MMTAKGTVLLVEDNAELNSNNTRALRMLGFAVYQALTLAQARVWLADNEPDVILLDVMLPDGDGVAFCGEIRSSTKAHILFLTAKTSHTDRVRGLEEGGDDYITKPFHPEELLARVEAVMRRRNMGRIRDSGTIGTNDDRLRAFAAHHAFTVRQTEILLLLCRGFSGEDITRELKIKEITLRPYISHMLKKSGAANRAGLVALAHSFQTGA